MASDEELFERLTSGDMKAFDRLYDRFERPVFGFILSQLGDSAEAEDALHEAFLTLLRQRRNTGEIHTFRAWFFTVARHVCLNRVRARKRADRAVDVISSAPRGSCPPTPDQEIELKEKHMWLERAVRLLPPPLAEVYKLRASGMSYAEVATVLDLPIGTVKSRMHELIRCLRKGAAR